MREIKEYVFVPYKGERPYIYVCASSHQSEEVLATLAILQKDHYRIWYDPDSSDEGEGTKEAEERLRGANAVLLFLSAEAIASPVRFKEIKTASFLKKSIIVERMDLSPIPEYWALELDDASFLTVTATGSDAGGKLSAAGRAVLASSNLHLAATPSDRARAIVDSRIFTRVYIHRPFEDAHIKPIVIALIALLVLIGVYLAFAAATGRLEF